MPYENMGENKDVVDVLFMVIAGHGNVKLMTKYLRQKQNTISMKLAFLRKEKLVVKDKWSYSPSWNGITKLFRELLIYGVNKNSAYKEGFPDMKKKDFKDFEKYFPDSFTRKFLESYAVSYLYFGVPQGLEPPSLEKLADDTILHLWFLNPSKLRKINPKFAELKVGISEFENDILDSFECMTDKNRRGSYKDDLDIIITKGEKEFRKVAKNTILTDNKKRGKKNAT